jgi:hypothetical protein
MLGNVSEWCLDYFTTNRCVVSYTEGNDFAAPLVPRNCGATANTPEQLAAAYLVACANTSLMVTAPQGPNNDAAGTSGSAEAERVIKGGDVNSIGGGYGNNSARYTVSYWREGIKMNNITYSSGVAGFGYRLVFVP